MSYPTTSLAAADERLDVLFDELAELTGQRNAIDGRIVEIVAEIDRDELWAPPVRGRSPALVAWKTGLLTVANAHTIAAVAGRLEEFPRCAQGCGRAGCRSIRSGSSPQRGARGLR